MKESYDNIYLTALNKVMFEGVEETNNRTNSKTKRLFGLDVIMKDCDYIPLLNIRKMYPTTVAAELAWTLSGKKSTEWLNIYTQIWRPFETQGEVTTAYGYRWRHEFGRDQLSDLISLLKYDKSSRQGVVVTWHPGKDGLLNQGKEKNVPCPYTFTSNIMNNKLNMLVTQRSADMMLGLPYDAAMYGLLNQSLAKSIGVKPGDVKFSIADAHIYEQFYPHVKTLNDNFHKINYEQIKFCAPYIESIQKFPDVYIMMLREKCKDYKPMDNIPKLRPNI